MLHKMKLNESPFERIKNVTYLLEADESEE